MQSVTYDKSGKDLLKRVDRFRASSERVKEWWMLRVAMMTTIGWQVRCESGSVKKNNLDKNSSVIYSTPGQNTKLPIVLRSRLFRQLHHLSGALPQQTLNRQNYGYKNWGWGCCMGRMGHHTFWKFIFHLKWRAFLHREWHFRVQHPSPLIHSRLKCISLPQILTVFWHHFQEYF